MMKNHIFHEKIEEMLLELMNFHLDLEKNQNPELKEWDFVFDIKKVKNFKNINFENLTQKEIVFATIAFYDFILINDSIGEIEKLYSFLFDNLNHLQHNKFFWQIILVHFQKIELSVLFVAILIFKALTTYSPVPMHIYKNYKNSDIVIRDLEKIFTHFCVYYEIKILMKSSFLKNYFFYLIEVLSFKKVILHIKINDFNASEKKLKTIKFYAMNNLGINFFNSHEYLNISFIKYEMVRWHDKYFLKSKHFSKVIEVFRKNWRSREEFVLKEEKYFDILLENGVFLDKNEFNFVIKTIENFENIKFRDLEKNIKDLVQKQQIVRELNKNQNLHTSDYTSVENYQKRISKLMEYYYLFMLYELNLEPNEKLYFPFYFDFRGRIYYDSIISITSSKIARLIFFYGWYEENELSVVRDYIDDIIDNNEEFIQIALKKFLISNNMLNKRAAFWLLLGIGKLLIDKSQININLKIFLELGLSVICENNDKIRWGLNLDDYLELMHYKNMFLDLNNIRQKKKIILKDATASVIQNLMRVLHPLNANALKIANLDNCDYWCDTYSFLLNEFLKTLNEDDKKLGILKYFKRKTIKKVIMTAPYAASYSTSFSYFKEQIAEEHVVNEQEIIDLKRIFTLFYRFVKYTMERSCLFKYESTSIVDYALEKLQNTKNLEIEVADAKANLVYYSIKTSYMDIIIKGLEENRDNDDADIAIFKNVRITKKVKRITEKIDIPKIKSSVRANWIHFIDATVVRELHVAFGKNILSIHDCFLIDIHSTNVLIINMNKIMSKNIFDEIINIESERVEQKSIFILL